MTTGDTDRIRVDRAAAEGHPDPPAVFAAAMAAMIALAVVLPGPDGVRGAWRMAGLAPVLAGAVLHRSAWRRLLARDTTVRADEEPRTLVTDGPFARTRNPMYLAGVLILLGGAVLLGRTTPFLVVPAYAWMAHRRFLPAEEEALEERFGESYRAYRERVRRWL